MTLNACPCCGGALGQPFYRVGPVPVHSCLMLDNAETAAAFPQADVQLAQCTQCGFVTNTVFDPKWSAYDPSYEDQQSFSPTFNSFAGQLAQDVVAGHDLTGKRVVEIGCSKGDFLRLLCEAGGMHATGIDPSALPGRIEQPARGSLTFHQDYYGPEHLDMPADLICCRHTLEHIQDVRGMLALMRDHAARNPGCVLLIEVPDSTRVWRKAAFEDIYYEHCSYFTAGSLARAFRDAGFAVTDLRREYDDQYLVLEASLDPAADKTFAIEETPADTAADIDAFRAEITGKLDGWRERLGANPAAQTAIWGSGSKCIAFLRTLGMDPSPGLIVDINPHRHGKYLPGLAQRISNPERIRDCQPRQVIAMNPIYRTEIQRDLDRLGSDAALMTL